MLNRAQLTKRLVAKLAHEEAVIAGIGNTNFDLYAAGHRAQNFYMLGSMGLACPIALGVALAQPERGVIALEGDGSMLMALGCLATIGMRQALPKAAYLAFTGTPLLKDEKTANKFGPIVHAYSMQRAVEDETVAPLLYEERVPELDINETAVNRWFDKITAGLSEAQSADLKKKFASKQAIYGAANRIELIAWDIATHFDRNFKQMDLGLKGQVATDSKLDEIGRAHV